MINNETIKRIAKLARVEVGQEENLSAELDKIIAYVDKLKEVNTEGIEPLRTLQEKKEAVLMRSDQVKKDEARQEILKNAPDLTDNFFKVPRVIK